MSRRLTICLGLFSLLIALSVQAAPVEWTSAGTVPGLKVRQAALGATFHQGVLHIVSLGRDRTLPEHTWWENGTWTAPTRLVNVRCPLVPSLASDGKTMHLVTEVSGKKLAYHSWAGSAWSDAYYPHNINTSKAPAIAAGDGAIHVIHCGTKSDQKRLYLTSNTGWGWTIDLRIPEQNSHVAPGMAVYQGALHQVLSGSRTKTLWHSSLTPWGQWTVPLQIPGTTGIRRPDLVVANGRLYAFFTQGVARMGEQATVAYCIFEDGRWSPPQVVEGYVSYGQVQAVVQPGVPQQIHLLLPNKMGEVVHLHTDFEITVAPLKPKKMLKR